MWRALIPYCHCTVPISVVAYRRMALLPLWVTGVGSVAALLIVPTDGSGIFAGAALTTCLGDVLVIISPAGPKGMQQFFEGAFYPTTDPSATRRRSPKR